MIDSISGLAIDNGIVGTIQDNYLSAMRIYKGEPPFVVSRENAIKLGGSSFKAAEKAFYKIDVFDPNNTDAIRAVYDMIEKGANEMEEITISKAMNGFIVRVGCEVLVFNDIAYMLIELKGYLLDPKAMTEAYMKKYRPERESYDEE